MKDAGLLLGMSATAVNKYENGLLKADSEKLIEFAEAYEVKSFDFLKTYKDPEMKFTNFRMNKNLTGKRLHLLKEIISESVSKNIEVIELNNISLNNNLKKYYCKDLNDAEVAANAFRKYLGISEKQPISDLISTLENLGILIVEIPNSNDMFKGFDGLSEIVNDIPVIDLSNDINDGARERFTIAHELGHLVLNTDSNLDVELACNRFAGSLLMPRSAVINEFGSSRNNVSFVELDAFKLEYKVSYAAKKICK